MNERERCWREMWLEVFSAVDEWAKAERALRETSPRERRWNTVAADHARAASRLLNAVDFVELHGDYYLPRGVPR